jgi:chromosome segregation ATPase
LLKAKENIEILESELRFSTEKAADMEQKLKFKDKEIENNKTDMKNRKIEIDILNGKIKENREETEEFIKKIKSLETQLSEVKASPIILERIREVMMHKGFLSDREFEKIYAEFE